MLLFFSFMLFNFFPREKSLTLRELAFPLFLRWKIFDHFQLLYTIGEMGNSYSSYRIELRNFQDTYGVLQNFGHVCLPATTLESQSWYVLPAYSFILDWNKCLVFSDVRYKKEGPSLAKHKKRSKESFRCSLKHFAFWKTQCLKSHWKSLSLGLFIYTYF